MDGVKLPTLYGWQHDALAAWAACDRRGIVEAVTGTGKTVVGVVAIAQALAEGRRVAVVVPGRELQSQWQTTLRRSLPGSVRIGLLGGGGKDTLRTHDVVVAIVNSARGNRLVASRSSMLVADECHRYASTENQTALDPRFELRLGLTATLERPDRQEHVLVDYFGPSCFQMTYPQAIADEVTAHFQVALIGTAMARWETAEYERLSKAISDRLHELVATHGVPRTPFHRFMADVKHLAEGPPGRSQLCAQQFLGKLYERKDLLANSPTKQAIVKELADAIRGSDRTLVFTDSIDAASKIMDDLRTLGLAAETIHSDLTPAERTEVMRRFASGKLQVLAAPRVLDEGIDVPAADLAIIVAASKTRRQMIQRMGRILRRKPDDRLARFAILYLEGTTEDPRLGAHEAFLGEILPVADAFTAFDSQSDPHGAVRFLMQETPRTKPGASRLAGEPPRDAQRHLTDDESSDASAFLALEEPTGLRRREPSQAATTPVARRPAVPASSRAIRSRNAPKQTAPDPVNARYTRLRQRFIDKHAPLTRTEVSQLDATLPCLVDSYDDETLLAAFNQTGSIDQLSSVAESIQRRLAQIRRSGSNQPSSQRNPDIGLGRKNRGPTAATGAAAGEKPHSSRGDRTNARYCPSCGLLEQACRC